MLDVFISLMNPVTFIKLWNNKKANKFLVTTINEILNSNDNYKLLETFNKNCQYLRSYIFLESKNKIVFIDFNKTDNNKLLFFDKEIIKCLKLIYKKKIILIIFNSFKGINKIGNDIYQIYQNNNSEAINFILSTNKKDQMKYYEKDLLNIIYNYNRDFYKNYINEERKMNLLISS